MAIEADVQSVVDKYARALEGPRLLFDLYPNPRPQSPPRKMFRPLPTAVVLGVIGGFEGFAEDLLAAVLYQQGYGWAHIASRANLTNPSVKDLNDKMEHLGMSVNPGPSWKGAVPNQTSKTGWNVNASIDWAKLLKQSDGWMQVRHCLSHGLVTGLGPEIWPGPLDKRPVKNQQKEPMPAASDVLATTSDSKKRALHFWSAVACARIYSVGASVLAQAAAAPLGETVNIDGLIQFDNV